MLRDGFTVISETEKIKEQTNKGTRRFQLAVLSAKRGGMQGDLVEPLDGREQRQCRGDPSHQKGPGRWTSGLGVLGWELRAHRP